MTSVVLIYPDKVVKYDSIVDASKATGISRQKIYRALNQPYGIIAGSCPQITVDLVYETSVKERCAFCPYYKEGK